MSPATESLILEHLRAIRTTLDRLSEDMQEVKGRLGILETQYASVSNRLDRIDDRVHRIELRLELVEG
jgi:archaellum component FlaC